MTESDGDEEKVDSKAAREAKKAAKEAAELEEQEKLRARRTQQLENARTVVGKIEKEVRINQRTGDRCEALSSHASGIYDEVNKLAKGRTILEATDLLVVQVNDIIRDAKAIIKGDVYLNRVKEFVPAGNNPTYPDVLVIVRVVRESLHRCAKKLRTQKERLPQKLSRPRTVVGALECFLSGAENGEYALKDDVRAYVDGDVDDSCFARGEDDDAYYYYFDFDKLDAKTLEEYLSIKTEDNSSESEDEEGRLDIDENLGDEAEEEE